MNLTVRKSAHHYAWLTVPMTIIAWMIVIAARNSGPVSATVSATDRDPPHTGVTAVLLAAILIILETAAVYGLLRPRTYVRNWQRAMGAFVLFLAWTLVNVPAIVIEGEPLFSLHFFWLVIVVVFLSALVIVSGIAAFFRRPASLPINT